MAQPPIGLKEVLNLQSLGVQQSAITFTNVTMESDKHICVRETGDQSQLVIIDTASPSAPEKRPIKADSALMHPSTKVIALKAAVPGVEGDNLQIFNLATKSKLKSVQFPQQVVFWKWVTPSKLGLVTATAVYHWDVEGAAGDPVKVFDRAANLEQTQIISYRVDPTEKWCVLVGIAPGAPERPQLVKGFMQLYSVEQARSQALEAHAAAFTALQLGGKAAPVISFAQKTLAPGGGSVVSKLHVIELGLPGQTSLKKSAELFFPPEFADDFPVSMQIRWAAAAAPTPCHLTTQRRPISEQGRRGAWPRRSPPPLHPRCPVPAPSGPAQRQVRPGVRDHQAGPAVCVRPGERDRGLPHPHLGRPHLPGGARPRAGRLHCHQQVTAGRGESGDVVVAACARCVIWLCGGAWERRERLGVLRLCPCCRSHRQRLPWLGAPPRPTHRAAGAARCCWAP
jgi:hypothetical protein